MDLVEFPNARIPGLILPAALAAATFGQCSCGKPVTGLRFEADRDGREVTTNMPCGHTRGE